MPSELDPITQFKAVMMVATGFATGALSLIAKRLTLRVVAESSRRSC